MTAADAGGADGERQGAEEDSTQDPRTGGNTLQQMGAGPLEVYPYWQRAQQEGRGRLWDALMRTWRQ